MPLAAPVTAALPPAGSFPAGAVPPRVCAWRMLPETVVSAAGALTPQSSLAFLIIPDHHIDLSVEVLHKTHMQRGQPTACAGSSAGPSRLST